MNTYISRLNAFLADDPPVLRNSDADSILDLLYLCYSESRPVDSATVRFQFKELDTILDRLSFSDHNAVFALTCTLCTDYARTAFTDGIRTGLQLFRELNDSPD